MRVVVSDASPLICLRHLGLLRVLGEMFGEVLLPATVLGEFAKLTLSSPGELLAESPFLRVASGGAQQVTGEVEKLDSGEREAIRLALSIRADLLLVDDLEARLVAARLGITLAGTLRLLLTAKDRKLIPLVMPLVEKLRIDLEFRVGAKLLAEVRRQAGE